jgi:hypothetical protein
LRAYLARHDGATFSAVKASHHGSRGNTSLDLVRLLNCRLWLFSTNGSQFRHPDQEAVARVIWGTDRPARLVFNYRTQFNSVWEGPVVPEMPFDCLFGDGYVSVDIRNSAD